MVGTNQSPENRHAKLSVARFEIVVSVILAFIL
jgi:hypothetical protein